MLAVFEDHVKVKLPGQLLGELAPCHGIVPNLRKTVGNEGAHPLHLVAPGRTVTRRGGDKRQHDDSAGQEDRCAEPEEDPPVEPGAHVAAQPAPTHVFPMAVPAIGIAGPGAALSPPGVASHQSSPRVST